jgi:hypothetical protein
MPDDATPQPAGEPLQQQDQPQAQPQGGTPAVFNFEEWLSKQPDDVRQGYETHVTGLKSALDKERAAAKKRQDKEADEERKRQEAALSETEKAAKRVADLEKSNTELADKWRAAQAREALRAAAGKAGIVFAGAQAEADAIGFAMSAVKVSDDGSVEEAETALKQIVKDRPYLVKAQSSGDGRGTPRPDGNPKPGAQRMSDDEKREFAALYGLNPKYLTEK